MNEDPTQKWRYLANFKMPDLLLSEISSLRWAIKLGIVKNSKTILGFEKKYTSIEKEYISCRNIFFRVMVLYFKNIKIIKTAEKNYLRDNTVC